MNVKLLAVALFGMMLFTSCGGDDCVQADWIGSFTGTQLCEDSEEEPWSVVITAGTDENTILIDGAPITIDGCSANGTQDLGILGSLTYDVELDGTSITGSINGSAFGEPVDCTFSGTK